MKKAGFTLAEILITLGIIGVLAAVLLPIANQIKPDMNKALYLHAYDALTRNTKKLANDLSIYPQLYEYDSDTYYNFGYYPLLNTKEAIDPAFKPYSGSDKYRMLLLEALDGDSDNPEDFMTKDGVLWKVYKSDIVLNKSTATFCNKVEIDVNGSAKPNKFYDDPDLKGAPDKFRFYVNAAGEVFPADPYGQMYVEKRNSLSKPSKSKIAKLLSGGDYSALQPENINDYEIVLENVIRESTGENIPLTTNKLKIPTPETCSNTCPDGYTLNSGNCTCECNKTCSSNFTLNKDKCSCDCNKTCSGNFTLNKDTCKCDCNKTCSKGYTLNSSTCECVKNNIPSNSSSSSGTPSSYSNPIGSNLCKCDELWDGTECDMKVKIACDNDPDACSEKFQKFCEKGSKSPYCDGRWIDGYESWLERARQVDCSIDYEPINRNKYYINACKYKDYF